MDCLPRNSWLLLLALVLPHAGRAEDAGPATPLPAGLADPVGRTGILANATGGLDVIDLTTGGLLWETKEAQRPLLVLGPRLYAQGNVGKNSIRLLAFDLAERGPCVLASEPVVLPQWAQVGESPGRSFVANWHRERNELVLDWQA